jgi:hypothetical protein
VFLDSFVTLIRDTGTKVFREPPGAGYRHIPLEARRKMKHFAMQEWVDFVRGAVSEEQRSTLQKHLDDGCSDCRKLLETWKHVFECTDRETSYQPPEAYVRMAKAQFAMSHPNQARSREVSYAELVFDSFAQPVSPGIRSNLTRARQLVFQKGRYSIDMRLESEAGRVAIVGQVLDSGQANSALADLPVRLLAYKQQTITSHFGEFQFEVERMEDLELLFVLSEERNLMISVPLSQGPSPTLPGVTVFSDDKKKA